MSDALQELHKSSSVNRIELITNSKNPTRRIDTVLKAGGSGYDVLDGSSDTDILAGYGYKDVLYGYEGNDFLVGDSGSDPDGDYLVVVVTTL